MKRLRGLPRDEPGTTPAGPRPPHPRNEASWAGVERAPVPPGAETRLRPLDRPVPIRVRTDREGRPLEILLPARGRAHPPALHGSGRSGRVMGIRETWRIDDEWWREPISRLYHEVVLENGRVLVLYRDLVRGDWWR